MFNYKFSNRFLLNFKFYRKLYLEQEANRQIFHSKSFPGYACCFLIITIKLLSWIIYSKYVILLLMSFWPLYVIFYSHRLGFYHINFIGDIFRYFRFALTLLNCLIFQLPLICLPTITLYLPTYFRFGFFTKVTSALTSYSNLNNFGLNSFIKKLLNI